MEIDRPGEWFGQPRGLTILFLTAMWELFAYYGMRTLLVYYMVKQLMLTQQRASLTYGIYTAFAYFTPLIGGFVSDRWLGRHRAVILGGSIMAAGLFMMASTLLLYEALTTIVIGYGLFLTTVPSQITALYSAKDPRRRSAFNFWYVGINIGAFFAPIVCGTVGELYGWNRGFPVAGAGMILGLAIYMAGRRYLPPDPVPNATRGSATPRRQVGEPGSESSAMSEMLQRFALLVGIAIVVVIFRTTYEQLGNTVPLWIETTHRTIGNWTIPMTWFQALDPFLAVLITPVFTGYWIRRARAGREPSSISKMAAGAGITALSFLLLAAVAAWHGAHGTRASWVWIVAFFVVLSFGEVHILPVGLGLFGRLAPKHFGATAIALWYFANFFGNLGAGALGTRWSHLSPAQFFVLAAAITGLSGSAMLLFDRSVRRLAFE
jgi:POT family proton-dependent oligopeptide transporter